VPLKKLLIVLASKKEGEAGERRRTWIWSFLNVEWMREGAETEDSAEEVVPVPATVCKLSRG